MEKLRVLIISVILSVGAVALIYFFVLQPNLEKNLLRDKQGANEPKTEAPAPSEPKVKQRAKPISLAANVPKGKRAMTLAMSEKQALDGSFVPGDTIDFTVIETQRADRSRFEGTIVLQNVRVLAVERKAKGVIFVTVALTPREVIVAGIMERKRYFVTLRATGDKNIEKNTKVAEFVPKRPAKK